MRSIQSINKKGNTVYVNFDDGTFGTRSFSDGKWTTHRISAEELAEAKRLAVRDGKWINYTARKSRVTPGFVVADEEESEQEAIAYFNSRKVVVNSESEIFG